MTRTAVRLALGFAVSCVALSTVAVANEAPHQRHEACSIHIWQRGIYKSESASNFGAYGLIGAILQDDYDRTYPAASLEGVFEDVLHIKALPTTIASIPWQNYTGVEENVVVFEPEAITVSRFEELKASSARNSAAEDSCYIELYIGAQTFSGSGIKSHLFSDFYARTYYHSVQKQKRAIMFDQTPRLSVKDAESLIEAKRIIADGFVATLTKFLANKLPKSPVTN